jgi:hypothetical protein
MGLKLPGGVIFDAQNFRSVCSDPGALSLQLKAQNLQSVFKPVFAIDGFPVIFWRVSPIKGKCGTRSSK